jgi:16S rRNA pseudouridine516 synthase
MKVIVAADLPDRLAVRGVRLDPLPGLIVVLNKPLGVTCSHKDEGPLVYELLPLRWRGRDPALSTVGRLDKETSGLLLLTDDGAFLHQIISPRKKVTKRYLVTLNRPLVGTEAEAFASGTLMLEGDDRPVAPAVLEPLSATTAWLTVTEGRYHLVRRMFAALGNHVDGLHRDRIGGLDLPSDIDPGRYRAMTGAELTQLFS